MAMSPQAFTLTGFERAGGVEYAQSWLVSDVGIRWVICPNQDSTWRTRPD
jgi:hypothetical protein